MLSFIKVRLIQTIVLSSVNNKLKNYQSGPRRNITNLQIQNEFHKDGAQDMGKEKYISEVGLHNLVYVVTPSDYGK